MTPPCARASLAGAFFLWGSVALAQTTPPADAPPPPPLSDAPALPPPPPSPPPAVTQSGWQTPPPLQSGPLLRAPRTQYTDTESEFEAARRNSFSPQCEDTQFGGRVVAESLAATAGLVGSGMLVYFMAESSNNAGMALLTLFTGVTAYVLVPPLAVHGVGRTFGGNGKLWASLVGGLLLPVVGHVVGYELSHETECEPDRRTAHRRRPSLASSLDDRAPRWTPAIAPTGQGGAIMGLTLAF